MEKEKIRTHFVTRTSRPEIAEKYAELISISEGCDLINAITVCKQQLKDFGVYDEYKKWLQEHPEWLK